ncbi:hypothetical protein FACS1894189_3740 [Planctomycetales bacterium]|nr:hypothetical protein FACS1894189_3740 [Planctomycetales bacterium]
MDEYQFHELCLIFPPCSDMELQYLVSDVRENGLKTPITLYQGKILDGRNRVTACLMAGIKPAFVPFEGKDPLGYVISQNLVRRHLSESQRAMVAAKLVEMKKPANFPISQKSAADSLNISERNVRHAANVLKNGDEETVSAIERGEKTVHAAVQEMKQAQLDAEDLSPVSNQDDKIKALRRTVLQKAHEIDKNMTELFAITGWNEEYTKLTEELRTIIFDE